MMERLKAVWRATAARDLCPTQSTPELRMRCFSKTMNLQVAGFHWAKPNLPGRGGVPDPARHVRFTQPLPPVDCRACEQDHRLGAYWKS